MENFEQNFPLERPHTGIPLANGNFGALVWGHDTLNLTIGQNDLWDHRIGELVDERDSYDRFTAYAKEHGYDSGLNKLFHRDDSFIGKSRRLPIGRFDFHFAEGIVPRKAELHYETGVLEITTSGNGTIRLVSVLKQNILYILDPGKEIKSVSLPPASDFPQVRQFNAERGMGEYERLADGWKI